MEERKFGPVRFLPGPNNGKYPYCHSIFIEGAGILIDPSSDRQRLEALRDTHDVNAVWLSHWHEDHIMASKTPTPGTPGNHFWRRFSISVRGNRTSSWKN